MGQGFACEQDAAGLDTLHRRPVHVVQHAFDEIAGGREILEALLVLNADGGAAEFIREAHGGDVHFALLRESGFR